MGRNIIKVTVVSICLTAVYVTALGQTPDRSRNYVMETVVRKSGVTDTAGVNALGGQDAMRTVTYHDGLGYPEQTIQVGAVPGGGHDLVLHREYDEYMRESRMWLPYADPGPSGAGFRTDARAATERFYAAGLTGMAGDTHPYSETVYEGSLLGRILEQGYPGKVWQPSGSRTDSTGRTTVTEWGTCTASGADTVRIWKVTDGGIMSPGNYLPGRLVRRTEKSPDWESGRIGTVDVYTDMDGRVVLERRWLEEDGTDKALDTYRVYDGLGRLRHVLPPLLSGALEGRDGIAAGDSLMAAYAWSYRYDGHGDCVWKKPPGAEAVEMVYDAGHHLALSRDGNQRERGVWSFCYHDGQGRPAVTGEGVFPDASSAGDVHFRATYDGTGEALGYRLEPALPEGCRILKITWYDGYGFIEQSPERARDSLTAHAFRPFIIEIGGDCLLRSPGSAREDSHKPASAMPGPAIILPDTLLPTPVPVPDIYEKTHEYDRYGSGRMTGEAVWSLGSDAGAEETCPLFTAWYYDDRGRTVQTRSMNHLGGWETETAEYSFTGMPVKRTLTHSIGQSDSVTVERYTYTWDSMDRPLQTRHSLDWGAEVVLADLSYDPLGRVIEDRRNGSDSLVTGYRYNIRSWQTGIESPLFTEVLYREGRRECGTNTPRYAGGISGSDWRVSGEKVRGYDYFYDGLDRLRGAEYLEEGIRADGYGTAYSYDWHGNMTELVRHRRESDVEVVADTIGMEYSGNRLCGVNGESGLTWDANGNVTSDLSSGIASAEWNMLNLPERFETVTATSGVTETAEYLYDGNGGKLRVRSIGHAGDTTDTDYTGNAVWRDGRLSRLLVDGGYIENGEYRFFVTDHLGSVRGVSDSDGHLLFRTDYYPYGAEYGYDMGSPSVSGTDQGAGQETGGDEAANQPYRYNGKEDQGFAGVPVLDYGARLYSVVTGRWLSQDPLGEEYYWVSPYVYCAGNPVDFVDVEGMIFTQESYELLQVLWDTIQKMRDRNERAIERHQAKLYESGISKGKERRQIKKIAKLMSRNSALDEVLVEVDEMASSSQTYNLIQSDIYNHDGDFVGNTMYNSVTGAIDMFVPQKGGVVLLAHELMHGYQFESGKINFGLSSDPFYDKSDERDAYARGAMFGTSIYEPNAYRQLSDTPADVFSYQKENFSSEMTKSDRHKEFIILANQKGIVFRINGFTYVGNILKRNRQ